MLAEEALVLKLQLSDTEKARDAVVSNLGVLLGEAWILGVHVCMLCDELVSFECFETTISDLERFTLNVAHALDVINSLVTGLHRSSVSSYECFVVLLKRPQMSSASF